MPFVDADAEIEKAAGMSIPDIFATHGEPDFRTGEARVIARLLDGGPQVLATGGGAFMNRRYPRRDRSQGRVGLAQGRVRRADAPDQAPARPAAAATDDPAATRAQLIDARYPVYALADITVQSREVPHDKIVDEIIEALGAELAQPDRAAGAIRGRARVMTAPLRASDPVVVDVALGARSYDIVIGRGQLATLGERIAKLRPGAKARDRQRRERRRGIISMRRWPRWRRRPTRPATIVLPPGESTKSFAHLRRSATTSSRTGSSATTSSSRSAAA